MLLFLAVVTAVRGRRRAALVVTRPVSQPTRPAVSDSTRRRVRERLEYELAEADRQEAIAIADEVATLDSLFADAKGRTPVFADDVLGYRSKWYLVADKLPFTRTDRHAQFLRATFDRDLFSPDVLTQRINQLVKDYVDRSNGIENQMLVRMRLDVADLPMSSFPAFSSDQTFRAAFDRSAIEVRGQAGTDLLVNAGQFAAGMVLQQVLTAVATRMGVSAGILGTSAGGAGETLGISLVVGLAVDQIVSWVWDWWSNPKGSLAANMNAKLDEMHRQIVDGTSPGTGLRAALEDVARKRSLLRQQCIDRVINAK